MINDGVGEEVSRLNSGSIEPSSGDALDATIEDDTFVHEGDGEGSNLTKDNDGASRSLEEDALLSNTEAKNDVTNDPHVGVDSNNSPGSKFKAGDVGVNLKLNDCAKDHGIVSNNFL